MGKFREYLRESEVEVNENISQEPTYMVDKIDNNMVSGVEQKSGKEFSFSMNDILSYKKKVNGWRDAYQAKQGHWVIYIKGNRTESMVGSGATYMATFVFKRDNEKDAYKDAEILYKALNAKN